MDYHKLTQLVIEELLEKAEIDITRFNYSDSDYEEENNLLSLFNGDEDARIRSITWKNISDEYIYLTMNLTEGIMTVEIPNDNGRIEINIGYGTEYPELKKAFIRLFKLVVHYVDVKLEEENLAIFYDSVRKNFPSIEDRLILETENDKKEIGDD